MVMNMAYVGLKYESLDLERLHLHVYADERYTINDDLSSHLGYIVMFCDNQKTFYILDF